MKKSLKGEIGNEKNKKMKQKIEELQETLRARIEQLDIILKREHFNSDLNHILDSIINDCEELKKEI